MAKHHTLARCQATGMVAHPTEPAALCALRALQRRAGFDGPMDRWRCTHCGGWHFGHRRKPRPQRKRPPRAHQPLSIEE